MMEAEIRRAPGTHLKKGGPRKRRTDGHEQIKITIDTKNEFTFHLNKIRWERGQALSGSSV